MPAYEPRECEEKWLLFWEKEGLFKADAKSDAIPYSICMPPPNVTGILHMGHALVNTLQDLLIRFKRMQGFATLWIPGTDHAGIATQTIVERDQMAKTGRRRGDFKREEFVELIWQWKEKSEKQILSQLKRLGCSCDWDRLAFTMDKDRSKAVQVAFKRLYDDGLIYQDDYLVNWDPITQTALADDEVEYEEHNSHLWHIHYPLVNPQPSGISDLIIATTRPETMLGDTAVAVHPDDPRYQTLIGKEISLPLTGRIVPIIADESIDPEFGTGAVKITPAHDPNDYEIAVRHDLEMINMMTCDGKINEAGGEFAGLTMKEGRIAITEEIKRLGLMEKVEPHVHRVGISYRSKAVIEPYLSKQWFVKMEPFKEKLIAAVKEKKVKIFPKEWEKTYFHWIENLRNWCISRQLVWGHQIPIWYRSDNREEKVCHIGDNPPERVGEEKGKWVQDEDVLDTWFSSALWPLSTLGWPEKTAELAKFYPNSLLVTGHDILFFWVARMIAMGQYLTRQVPFPKTLIHGLIYGKSYWRYHKDGSIDYLSSKERISYDLGKKLPSDVHAKWEKMSKSKGNVIDPIEIIDSYGTDAMRASLCSVPSHGRQIDLDRRKFEEGKNLINKLWNGAHFVMSHLDNFSYQNGIDRPSLQLEDRWILSRLNQLIQSLTHNLETYAFDRGFQAIYHFFWDEFCSYYLELSKPTLFGKVGKTSEKSNKQAILLITLCNLLRLFHPIAPFVTEELFSQLKHQLKGEVQSEQPSQIPSDPYLHETACALGSKACTVAPFPTSVCPEDIDPQIDQTFAFIGKVLHAIRTIRAELQLGPRIATDLFISANPSDPHFTLTQNNVEILRALIPLGVIDFNPSSLPEGLNASNRVEGLALTIPLPQEMREKERLRLEKKKEKLIVKEHQIRRKLANENFLVNAPKELVEKSYNFLKEVEQELAEVGQKLSTFS